MVFISQIVFALVNTTTIRCLVFVSQHGDKIDEKEKIKCPEGWEWTGNWQVDDNRAVDDEGITY